MTSDQSACGTFDLAMEGKLSLDIKSHSSSKRSITIIAYLEYDAIYEIDAQGNVHGNEWEDSHGKMNNLQLHNLANRCPALKEIFVGLFPSDRLPDLPFMKQKRAYALIANLDKEGLPSSHWVALYLPKQRSGTAEYFDSYGQPLTLPSFLTLLRKYNRYVYNHITLQSPISSVCGQYCLFYLWRRARRHTISSIFVTFRNLSVYTNDIVVNKYVRQYFRTNLKLFDVNFIGRQIAISLQKAWGV